VLLETGGKFLRSGDGAALAQLALGAFGEVRQPNEIVLAFGSPLTRAACAISTRSLNPASSRTFPRRSPSTLAADAQLPHAIGAKRLAREALPGALGADPARLASWHDL
jgi:hypothetical protein